MITSLQCKATPDCKARFFNGSKDRAEAIGNVVSRFTQHLQEAHPDVIQAQEEPLKEAINLFTEFHLLDALTNFPDVSPMGTYMKELSDGILTLLGFDMEDEEEADEDDSTDTEALAKIKESLQGIISSCSDRDTVDRLRTLLEAED